MSVSEAVIAGLYREIEELRRRLDQLDRIEVPSAGGSFTSISDVKLTSDAASMSFSSIPGTYKHLKIIGSMRAADAVTFRTLRMQFNSDTGNNYDSVYVRLYHTNTILTAELLPGASIDIFQIVAGSGPANQFTSFEIVIPDYADTGRFKNAHSLGIIRYDITTGTIRVITGGGDWRSTSAITQISLFPNGGNLLTGSHATLYGLN